MALAINELFLCSDVIPLAAWGERSRLFQYPDLPSLSFFVVLFYIDILFPNFKILYISAELSNRMF